MSERKKALTVRPAAYAVGYGKPPAHSRFTPGQSGNPKGRPKGARNRAAAPGHQENRLQSIILDEAYRGVPTGSRAVAGRKRCEGKPARPAIVHDTDHLDRAGAEEGARVRARGRHHP